MAPTLTAGSIVNYARGAPGIGKIGVFHPPEGAEQERCGPKPHLVDRRELCVAHVASPAPYRFIKRIVAGPGDEIYIRAGHVYRKAAGSRSFAPETNPRAISCGRSFECDYSRPVRVPTGEWYMLGDNRALSDDSRLWGPVPTAWILGVVSTAR